MEFRRQSTPVTFESLSGDTAEDTGGDEIAVGLHAAEAGVV